MKFDFKKQWSMWLVLALGIVLILFWDNIKSFFTGMTKSEEEKKKENLFPEKERDPGKTYQQRAVIWDRHVALFKHDVCTPIVLVLTQTHNYQTKAIKYFESQNNSWISCNNYILSGPSLLWQNMLNKISQEDQWIIEQCPELFTGHNPMIQGEDTFYVRKMSVIDLGESSPFVQELVYKIYKGKYIEMEFVGEAVEV